MTSAETSKPLIRWSWPQGAFAARMIISALLSYWVSELLGFTHGYSAVFSALIVVRPYQQGALKAGVQRLLATAMGIAMAFAAVVLRRTGLNDYELLLLALGPLALLVAYDSGYRTAMISALLMLSAPFTKIPELDIALVRASVVSLGAVVGIAVSIFVLPQPHRHVIGDKAQQILRLMLGQLTASLEPAQEARKTDKADQRLRKSLMELGQMVRDHAPRNPDEDASVKIVGLTRHVQSLCLLLRSQWRRDPMDDEARAARHQLCQTLLERLSKVSRAAPAEEEGDDGYKAIFAAIRALPAVTTEAPETWMLATLARDVAGLEKLLKS